MGLKRGFPIQYKLFLLIGTVVLLAILTYNLMAIWLFRDDKVSLVYELNRSNVRTIAAEVDTTLRRIVDKMELMTRAHQDEQWMQSILGAEENLVIYSLFQADPKSGEWREQVSVKKEGYLELYGGESGVADIRQRVPLPFAQILAKGLVVRNSTVPDGAPLLTLALPVELVGEGNQVERAVAVADLKLEPLLRIVRDRGIATVFIIDANGTVISHPDAAAVAERRSMAELPIVQEAQNNPVGLKVTSYEHADTTWLGAYAKVGAGGLSVISQVDENEAFKAAWYLVEKSVVLGLLIITVALFFSSRMAKSFTDPLYQLLSATRKLSRWEFGELIKVQTHDEIAILARSFNKMLNGLRRQRQQIEEYQAGLEKKVKERTEALEKQKKKAAEANEALIRTTRLAALGELAGVAAHEVLNPVNNLNIRIEKVRKSLKDDDSEDLTLLEDIVMGWSEAYKKGGIEGLRQELEKPVETEDGRKIPLLEEDLENVLAIARDSKRRSQEKGEDMQFLSQEVGRISKIVNNMRPLVKVSGSKSPINVRIPIESTIAAMSDLFERARVELKSEINTSAGDESLVVVADKDELVQALSNLVRNALHAVKKAKRKDGVVTISADVEPDEQRVVLRVTDNGTGIGQEHVGRIFEPDFTTKSIDEGTGIGLSITRRLIRGFGGDVQLERTAAGEGTQFMIWLPMASATGKGGRDEELKERRV